jgi:hypothetical protein
MRRTEVVTIKATDTVKALAAKANMIQDACNSRAVARFLLEVQDHFAKDTSETGQKFTGGDMAAQNPVSVAVLNKLNHLAGLEQSKTDCFVAVLDLADGKDVDWPIEFLM